ncbi:hypothetical protein NDK47_16385 [Brevibacillus ruminantium]|uniref:Uncharacterized protein n=1 Tax=Brevibacillus ruminantium TaxID=2950604 RepID=A0ABY4WGG4_9BACL|nr:hypothetical protein [Brevibacillus ruminantium]USG63746.1 hypothetical protein NDK47_16385 [Brevibacillus ruminantium]
MFRRKWGLALIGIGLFLIAWVLNIRFPHEMHLIDTLVESMGFPAWSRGTTGMHYAAIVPLSLMIIAYCLLYYVTKRPILTFLLLMLFPALLPDQQEVVRWYQRTMAKGVYMIEYKEDQSRCTAKTSADGLRNGSCVIVLKNHGAKSVKLELTVFGQDGRKKQPVLSDYPIEIEAGGIEQLEVPVDPSGRDTGIYEEWFNPRITISYAGAQRDL